MTGRSHCPTSIQRSRNDKRKEDPGRSGTRHVYKQNSRGLAHGLLHIGGSLCGVWFNLHLQWLSLLSVEDCLYFDKAIMRMEELSVGGLYGTFSLVYCSSHSFTILEIPPLPRS